MASLWDLGKAQKQEVEQHKKEYRKRFEENMENEYPLHPFNLEKKIIEEEELKHNQEDMRRKEALRQLRSEFKEEWRELANGRA